MAQACRTSLVPFPQHPTAAIQIPGSSQPKFLRALTCFASHLMRLAQESVLDAC